MPEQHLKVWISVGPIRIGEVPAEYMAKVRGCGANNLMTDHHDGLHVGNRCVVAEPGYRCDLVIGVVSVGTGYVALDGNSVKRGCDEDLVGIHVE